MGMVAVDATQPFASPRWSAKKPQVSEWLGDCGFAARRLMRKNVRNGPRIENTQLRDVGSLAGSAASGHKSRVFSILLCTG
jgi:hypothetical protein